MGCVIFFGFQMYQCSEVVSTFWIIALSSGLTGFFLIPLTSLYFTYSAEVAFPIGEASAGGYLFAASQTFGFILGLIVISLIDPNDRNPSIYIIIMF